MNRSWIVLGAAMTAGVLWQGCASAQQPREKINVSQLGPQVGERVPAFSLRDQDGTIRDLRSIRGPKGTMLVFIRSADW